MEQNYQKIEKGERRKRKRRNIHAYNNTASYLTTSIKKTSYVLGRRATIITMSLTSLHTHSAAWATNVTSNNKNMTLETSK